MSSDNISSTSPIATCRILWSTQSGRAKACARRAERILREKTTVKLQGGIGSSFDELKPVPFIEFAASDDLLPPNDSLLVLFVSTTGDGEQCDSIRETWKALLQKSLSRYLFRNKQFALFCLGDRAYGPQFCAAGRKLAVRLMQLGMTTACEVGYGDDNTPNGGVFRDLDVWLEEKLLKILEAKLLVPEEAHNTPNSPSPYNISSEHETFEAQRTPEWKLERFEASYTAYFARCSPLMAYAYNSRAQRVERREHNCSLPLLGSVAENRRITASDWEQDTRHLRISINCRDGRNNETSNTEQSTPKSTPYCAGDVVSILPFNNEQDVNKFLSVLPHSLASIADSLLRVEVEESSMDNRYTRWPLKCTLRGWLTFCADINSLPEREDLRDLSRYCSTSHELGRKQAEKLSSLSETSQSALYADYILREKRSWADVLYDFESLRSGGSTLTLEALFILLPPMRPRDFSIASAPSVATTLDNKGVGSFSIELCVAIVQGSTRLGRKYHGLCSQYLAAQVPGWSNLILWIRPGTFGKLPLEVSSTGSFVVPILCVGAGTGIAPMRSLLLERHSIWSRANHGEEMHYVADPNDNILLFGCRMQRSDFYYRHEWESLARSEQIRLLTAFSRDQVEKVYVQNILRGTDGGTLVSHHILDRGGAVYIAGGPKMARAVKEEIVAALVRQIGDGKQANQILNNMQRLGRFSIEAWS